MKILTYNISWEAMTGSPYGSAGDLGRQCGNNICFNNVIKYIKKIPLDFIALQECARSDEIIKELNHENYNYFKNKNGKETILTLYKKKYELLDFKKGYFTKGRPYHALYFKNFIFVNLHYLGASNTEKVSIIEKFKFLDKNKKIILAGDFNLNFNYCDEIIYENKKIIIGDFVCLNPQVSCCSTRKNERKFDYGDCIFTNYLFTIKENKKGKNIIKNKNLISHLSSDHYPIYSEV